MPEGKETREMLFPESKYFFLPSNITSDEKRSPILFVARHPGAANCLIPVARYFQQRGTSIFFNAQEEGKNIIVKEFKNNIEISGNDLPKNLGWTLLSADEPVDFEVEAIKKARSVNPSSKIAIVEDYPNSVRGLLEGISINSLKPDLVLATTRTQADIYRGKFAPFGEYPIIPIGQPSFDDLLTENTIKKSKEAREKLNITANTKVVTYIGMPTQDAPKGKFKSSGNIDLNSYILADVAKSMITIALSQPDYEFILINRPHPREREEMWQHPELKKLDNQLPNNLKFISPSKEGWKDIGLTTREVCTASDVITTFVSTVGQEVALSGARLSNRTTLGSLPLHILPMDAQHSFLPDGLPLEQMGATAVARNDYDTLTEIKKCLFDTQYQERIKEGQRKLVEEYRFKSTATQRVALWMRAIDRFGGHI